MPQKFNPLSGAFDLVLNPGSGPVASSFLTDSGTATPDSSGQVTVSGGNGVTTEGSSNTLTLNVTGGGYTWVVVSGTSDDIEEQNGYQTENGSLTTLTIPATMSVHQCFRVLCLGSGLVRIAQRAGQTIRLGNTTTTTGVTGYIQATDQGDCVEIKCTTTDTDFCVLSSIGNWSIV